MNEIVNITKWIFNPFLVKKPEQVKIVALCITVATIFWFLNAFNKTYTTTLSFPVEYQYDKEKFTPLAKLNPTINISITGQGWDLLKETFSLESEYIKIKPQKLPGINFINPESLLDSTKEQLSKFTINRIYTDSVKYHFDYKVSKLINISLPIDSIKLENGYAIVSEIQITPNQVYITGAASILDTIPENYIIDLKQEIDDDFNDEIQLNFPKEINSETNEVNINFEIQPYIEIVKDIKYNVINLKDTTLKFKPEVLELKVYTTEKYEDSINDSMFVYDLNMKKFSFESDTFLKPKLTTKIPSYIKRIVLEDSLIYISKP